MNIICAFSSDFRELYKGDIYRAFALPDGHVLHFRYKTKYVDENLMGTNAKLKNKKVVIFYTHGNRGGEETLNHVSVRQAFVVDAFLSEDTGVFHVYMKLDSFCNVRVDTVNSSEKKPPIKFFTELNCTFMTQDNAWQSRVNAVKDLLPKLMYFRVKGISCDGRDLKMGYADSGRSGAYKLRQGKRHVMHLSIGNPDGANSKVDVREFGDDIALNVVRPLETSAQFDDIDIPLIVHTLQVASKPALLSFIPIVRDGESVEEMELAEYSTNIELVLSTGIFRPALFGVLSTLALLAIFVSQPHEKGSVFLPWWAMVGMSIVFAISTSFLYLWFNKK